MKKRLKPKPFPSSRKPEIRHTFWDSLVVVGLLLGIFWVVSRVVGGFHLDSHELVGPIITAVILVVLVIVLAFVNAFLLERKITILANWFERLAAAALGLLLWVFPFHSDEKDR
jgi:tetrahydromethanopterin S-methyltransferase subunit C